MSFYILALQFSTLLNYVRSMIDEPVVIDRWLLPILACCRFRPFVLGLCCIPSEIYATYFVLSSLRLSCKYPPLYSFILKESLCSPGDLIADLVVRVMLCSCACGGAVATWGD